MDSGQEDVVVVKYEPNEYISQDLNNEDAEPVPVSINIGEGETSGCKSKSVEGEENKCQINSNYGGFESMLDEVKMEQDSDDGSSSSPGERIEPTSRRRKAFTEAKVRVSTICRQEVVPKRSSRKRAGRNMTFEQEAVKIGNEEEKAKKVKTAESVLQNEKKERTKRYKQRLAEMTDEEREEFEFMEERRRKTRDKKTKKIPDTYKQRLAAMTDEGREKFLEEKRIKTREYRSKLAEEQLARQRERSKFWKISRAIEVSLLPEEEQNRIKMEKYLRYAAYKARTPKDKLEAQRQRKNERRRKLTLEAKTKDGMTKEKLQQLKEYQARAGKKWWTKLKQENPEEYWRKTSGQQLKRYSEFIEKQRDRVKNETLQQREARLLRYRINQAKGKLKKKLESEGLSSIKIEEKLQQLSEEIRNKPRPTSVYKPRIRGRRPHKMCEKNKQYLAELAAKDKDNLQNDDNSQCSMILPTTITVPEPSQENLTSEISVLFPISNPEPIQISSQGESATILYDQVVSFNSAADLHNKINNSDIVDDNNFCDAHYSPPSSPQRDSIFSGADNNIKSNNKDVPSSSLHYIESTGPNIESQLNEEVGLSSPPTILTIPTLTLVYHHDPIISVPCYTITINKDEMAGMGKKTNNQVSLVNEGKVGSEGHGPKEAGKDKDDQEIIKEIRVPDGGIICDLCGKVVKNLRNLKIHKELVHNPHCVITKCPQCGLECSSTRSLWNHFLKQHMNDGQEEGDEDISTSGHSTKPRKQQAQPKQWKRGTDQVNQCEYCGKQFRQKCTLDDHVRRAHQGKRFCCEICGGSYDLQSAGKLWKHMVEKHGMTDLPPPQNVQVIRCVYCEEIVLRGYEGHVKKRHPELLVEFMENEMQKVKLKRPKVVKEKPYRRREQDFALVKCPHCSKDICKISLARHLRNIHGIGKTTGFECDECGKWFKEKYRLKEHVRDAHAHNFEQLKKLTEERNMMRFENGKKKHKKAECLLCNIQIEGNLHFTVKAHFVLEHHEIFEELKDAIAKLLEVECEACQAKFTKIGDLRSHMISSHPEESWICTDCNVFKKTQKELANHIKIHRIDASKKACELCPVNIPDILELENHVKNIHPGSYWSCSYCPVWKYSEDQLSHHIHQYHKLSVKQNRAAEIEKMNVFCEHCDLIMLVDSVTKHKISKHGIDEHTLSCDHCPRTFEKRQFWLGHLETVHGVQLNDVVRIAGVDAKKKQTERQKENSQRTEQEKNKHKHTRKSVSGANDDNHCNDQPLTRPSRRQKTNLSVTHRRKTGANKCNADNTASDNDTKNIEEKRKLVVRIIPLTRDEITTCLRK